MMKPRIGVIDRRYDAYEEELRLFQGIEAEVRFFRLSPEDPLPSWLEEAEGILVNLYPLPAERLRRLRRCRAISRYGIGYDTVDVAAAAELGISTAVVPDYIDDEVASHTAALLLAAARNIVGKDRAVRQGRWDTNGDAPLYRIAGSVLGIIGYGTNGRRIHQVLAGFGFRETVVYDPYVATSAVEAAGGRRVSFEELLALSDYVTINTPRTDETNRMINAEALSLMKPTAVLVNTARGGIVDENALADALRNGRLRAAGLDVYEEEPPKAESPLRNLDNLVLSDHSAFYSVESLSTLKRRAAENLLALLDGELPERVVAGPLS